MNIATFRDIKSVSLGYRSEESIIKTASTYKLNEIRLQHFKTVFLSHSTMDKALLPYVIKILENHDSKVYIDKEDSRLPVNTSPETARILKSTIRECNKFILFVTKNSKESKWVPWELGLGDEIKSPNNVALFPALEYSFEKDWTGQEYLGLYQRIICEKRCKEPTWYVYDKHRNSKCELGCWIRQ